MPYTFTTAQLREQPGVQFGHVFLMDGIVIGFCDRRELVGLGTGSGHDVRLGLSRDSLSYRMALDLRTGELLQSPAAVPIVDLDDDLVALFRAADATEQPLTDVPFGGGRAIQPAEDLSGRSSLHERHVGLECIGPDGERHQYPVPTNAPDTWGMLHTIATDGAGVESAPVSEEPIVWNGRRCELRRCYIDRDGTPRPFAESRRLWMGTLRDDGKVRGRSWTVEADGPESLLRKPLALGWQKEPVPAVGDASLVADGDERETGVGIYLQIPGGVYGPMSLIEFTTDLVGTTPNAIRDEIRALINTAAADATLNGPFAGIDGCSVSMDAQGWIRIKTTTVVDSPAILAIALHRKVWSLLGYDVAIQNAMEKPDAKAISFHSMATGYTGTFAATKPGGDYWKGEFPTGTNDTNVYPNGATNGGVTRLYGPLYDSGTHTLRADLNGGRGQVFRLADAALGADTSQSTVAHPGQRGRPVASLPTNPAAALQIPGVGACNRTGFWLFFGKRRYQGEGDLISGYAAGADEVFDEVWVGEASWVGAIEAQAGLVSGDQICVTKWWDPALFGFRSKGGPTSDWVARVSTIADDEGTVRAVPIAVAGYSDGFDAAHKVLMRALLTTGTSVGWSSFAADGAATQAAGANEPSEAPSLRCDAEVAPLGLAIPAAWVAAPSEFDAVAARVENPALLRVKAAFSSGYPAADLVRSLMQPAGWCWHLRNGRLGIWCPADGLTLADATTVIDRSVRGEIGGARWTPPTQGMRFLQPIDRFRFAMNLKPHFGGTTQLERTALDRAYAYRPGNVTHEVLAHHMRKAEGVTERLLTLSVWWARRHYPVNNYPISLIEAEDAWPGTIVRLTDSELCDPTGVYGVTNRIAIITALRVELADGLGGRGGTASIDLVVLDGGSANPRHHAPVAIAIGYDSATQRIITTPDGFGIPGGGSLFVEPAYSGVLPFGGDAIVECWQWDGSTLAQTCSGTVDSAAAGYIQLTGAITGTYYRDRDTIVVLRPSSTSNAAWVDALFSPINDAAGQHAVGMGTANGYNWEP